jgi:hypothetical protein
LRAGLAGLCALARVAGAEVLRELMGRSAHCFDLANAEPTPAMQARR